MTEDDELARIRKKKIEELMKRQQESSAPKPQTIVEVFTSPTCPHCPRALMMARQLAVQMPGIQVIELSTDTPQGYAKAALYGVQAVPTIFINGKRAFTGAPPSIEALRQFIRQT
ncbi:glutaredoxin-like protein [Candidatus Methanoperedens nitroreducens]|uniref:Glutaredoxin-like protein n=1 Tax=Candidatus Methanoperedens nitratireducens TaxID=1392998 RepID=A0A062V823_9EURY|nr:thioredoxin family protein [Candidatus Methanoperedens nitroreducens]KCZ71909.1 glutaredoxin-like protein [Candidatus Methanoperedens nitroreducens]MDJ1422117.1 thioredoxin family protein [Candidatus Methanoperedens sp.]